MNTSLGTFSGNDIVLILGNTMPKPKFALPDKRKYHKQIDKLKELWPEEAGDLQYLDDIPNYTGPDEPIPFPYGVQGGKGSCQRGNK